MKRATFSLPLLMVLLLSTLPVLAAPRQANAVSDKAVQRITKEVRHELLMLPNLRAVSGSIGQIQNNLQVVPN